MYSVYSHKSKQHYFGLFAYIVAVSMYRFCMMMMMAIKMRYLVIFVCIISIISVQISKFRAHTTQFIIMINIIQILHKFSKVECRNRGSSEIEQDGKKKTCISTWSHMRTFSHPKVCKIIHQFCYFFFVTFFFSSACYFVYKIAKQTYCINIRISNMKTGNVNFLYCSAFEFRSVTIFFSLLFACTG